MPIFNRVAVLAMQRIPKDLIGLLVKLGSVEVKCLGYNDPEFADSRVILIASNMKQTTVQLDSDSFIRIDDDRLKECEKAIESVANLISITSSTGYYLYSDNPCFFFSKLNPDEVFMLQNCKGLRRAFTVQIDTPSMIEFTSPAYLAAIQDRIEGVSILAEANQVSHATSKFREYVRFFELAFRLSLNDGCKKLFNFLDPAGFGFTKDEIEEWVALRGPVVHGDKKESTFIATHRDVIHLIPRMRLAALDVLMNKAEWHSKTTNRVERHKPLSYPKRRIEEAVLLPQDGPEFTMQMFDTFGAYPIEYRGLPIQLPDNTWVPKLEYVVDLKALLGQS